MGSFHRFIVISRLNIMKCEKTHIKGLLEDIPLDRQRRKSEVLEDTHLCEALVSRIEKGYLGSINNNIGILMGKHYRKAFNLVTLE